MLGTGKWALPLSSWATGEEKTSSDSLSAQPKVWTKERLQLADLSLLVLFCVNICILAPFFDPQL